MNRVNSLKLGLLMLCLLFTAQIAQAGVLADIKLWFNEKANIVQHSRAISSEVKTPDFDSCCNKKRSEPFFDQEF